MFQQPTLATTTEKNTNSNTTMTTEIKYKNILSNSSENLYLSNEMSSANIDFLLEREKQNNKKEGWNKLDKTIKIQKLHGFAEKYGKENSLSAKEIKSLKLFFTECLEKNKLQKTKDINYDKETHEIISMPVLFFNTINRNFTLKNLDAKRVSTLKSLTPKRITEKNNHDDDEEMEKKPSAEKLKQKIE